MNYCLENRKNQSETVVYWTNRSSFYFFSSMFSRESKLSAMGFEFEDLKEMDSNVLNFQKQGDSLSALKCLERGILLRTVHFGENR